MDKKCRMIWSEEEMTLSVWCSKFIKPSRKWRLVIKTAKIEKADLTLSFFVQYAEDFKYGGNVSGIPHRLPDQEIAKWIKAEYISEELYSWYFENLDDVVWSSRRITYIMEITD